jgi:uncharacterized protein (TIRG00374 family)
MSEEDPKSKKSNWRALLTVVTFVALAILIYFARHQIADVTRNLRHVNTFALLFLIPIQIINYDAYARMYRRIFQVLGKEVRYRALYRLTLELTFVNHILPSGGISGVSYFGVRLKGEGVSVPQSTVAQLLKFLLLFLSFQPLLVLGVILLAIRGHVNGLILVIATSLITLLITGTLVALYAVESRERISSILTFITKIINGLIHLVRPKHPETFSIERAQFAFYELHDNYKVLKKNFPQLMRGPFLFALIANITEIAAVYTVYVAFGHLVNVGAVILAYAVANFAGLISVLPAGVGIYEGLMTAVLAATGIPASLSIPVTIMYRVLNMFIQLLPGYILYQNAVRKGLTEKI